MRRGIVAMVLWLAMAGCGPDSRAPTGTLMLDLASQIALAEIAVETDLIELGTPESRRFLGAGWSWNEQAPSGDDFVWSSRHSSELSFFLSELRPLEIRFRCLPYRHEDGLVETLSIAANGSRLEDLSLRRGWNEYTQILPIESLKRGVNHLTFDYHWTPARESPATSKPGRQVAVAWDWIRFPGIDTGSQPHSPDSDTLVLTPYSQTEYFFQAPGPTGLEIAAIETDGLELAPLEISVLREGEPKPELLAIDSRSRKSSSWPLTSQEGLVRLRLVATDTVRLVRARVQAEPPSTLETEEVPLASDPTTPRVRPRLILLYVIDTLRADRWAAETRESRSGSGLHRLLHDGVTFTDTLAQSTWTRPSTASILTGELPWIHGAETAEEALAGTLRPLPQYLADLGYATGGFSANGNISSVFGFHHGFEHFSLMGRFDATATEVHHEALQWLADQADSDPVFLYIHTIDPHAPYVATDRYASPTDDEDQEVGTVPFMRRLAKSRDQPHPTLIEKLNRQYQEEVASSRRSLAELIEALERRGLYEEALILVVSDHGEEFYDHGQWTHGRNLHRATLQVPLLIKFPDNWAASTRVETTAQQIDLLPTVLDYLGHPLPELPGRSLIGAIESARNPGFTIPSGSAQRPAFASVHYHNNHWLGVVLGDWKLMIRGTERLDRQAQLFDRRQDPEETHNLAELHPLRTGYLTSLIRAELQRPGIEGASRPVDLDDETRQRLEALGYLN